MNAAEALLGAQALARHGERTALVCGNETITYADLGERVARASAALAGLGIAPGDVVLLLMRDTAEFAAAWLGAVRLGAAALAINNKLSETDYRHILADSGARLALVEDSFAEARPDLSAELARERRLVVAGTSRGHAPEWRRLQGSAAPPVPFDAPGDWPAFYLYSSGTTGRPKGIVHSHAAVAHSGAALRMLGLREGERVFTTSRFFFAYGLEHALLGPLALGATSIVCPDWPDADTVVRMAADNPPALFFSVPTMYRRLLAEPAGRLAPFRQVRHCVAAGERLSAQLVEQWAQATGVELLSLYGMSETYCACLVTPPGSSDGHHTGAPLTGVELKLLDARGEPVSAGEPGVLWVRHPTQARMYHRLPERTQEQFLDGWFCTRDLFVRDARGRLVHQGRSDELVKIAGQWVLPSELEEAAAAAREIAEAACVAVPDEDGLERLALFLIPRGDPGDAVRAAEQACARALPQHKRPKWLRAVDELPRTATGKVQRFKLRELLARDLKLPR